MVVDRVIIVTPALLHLTTSASSSDSSSTFFGFYRLGVAKTGV